MSVSTIGLKPGIRMYFAVGNHMFPRSRYSIGMQVAEKLARTAKSGWFLDRRSMCNISESASTVLALPLTYLVHDNVTALSMAMRERMMNINDVVILTYSTELEFGSMKLEEGGPTSGHMALEPIFDLVQTEAFKRLSIGISHPPNLAYNPDVLLSHDYDVAKYNSFFLCNKFPANEQFALDHVVLPAAERLLADGNHDITHTYTYKEIMALADRIKSNSINKLQYEELKQAQTEELKQNRASNPNYQKFANRI